MLLNTETWSKEVCDLIDYDNDKLITNTLNIKSTSYIYRKVNEVIDSQEKINKSDHELLFKIRMSFGKKKYLEIIRNKYELDENDNLVNPNPCFFILKPSKIDIKMNRYKLSPGEVVKIGRITMRIRDIKFKDKYTSPNNTINEKDQKTSEKNKNGRKKEDENKKMTRLETSEGKLTKNLYNGEKEKKVIKKKTQKDIFSKLEKMKRVCRICYLEEDEEENPLVQPCICTGSVKFIHLTCLRKWVSTRSCVKIDTSPDCSIFLIKPVECELCKKKFPDFIKYENRLLPVIDFSQEFDNYLTLESLTLDRQNNKFIYAISLDKERKIKIGRGHEARVLLSDISVSRVHCIMTVEKGKVFIEDNDSKFGTLILVQTPSIKISENLPLYIQVGRTYFECKLIKPFKLFNCCEVEEKTNIFYYYNQNEKYIKDNLGMVVKPDLSDIDSEENLEGNLINNTFEQKFPLDIVNKYKYEGVNEKIIVNGEGDKMSDNEYFLLKHNKKKKNIKKEMIYDSDEEKKEENEKKNNEEENANVEDNNENGDDDYDDDNNEDNVTASLNDEDESSEKSDKNEENKNEENKNENNNNENNNNLIEVNNDNNNNGS